MYSKNKLNSLKNIFIMKYSLLFVTTRNNSLMKHTKMYFILHVEFNTKCRIQCAIIIT